MKRKILTLVLGMTLMTGAPLMGAKPTEARAGQVGDVLQGVAVGLSLFNQLLSPYGTWYNDSDYGWVWVPGYTWGPAWVTWQYTDDYVGWAPLPPSYNLDVGYNRYNDWNGLYNSGYYNRYYQAPVVDRSYYVYVP